MVNLAYLFLFFMIMTPSIGFISSFPKFRMEELLIFPAIFLLALWRSKIFVDKKMVIIFSLMASSVALSLYYSNLVLSDHPEVEFSIRDFYEIIKVAQYLFIFLFFYSVRHHRDKLQKVMLTLFVAAATFAIFQYLDLFGINNLLSKYYLREGGNQSFVFFTSVARRVIGTAGNPIYFGQMMVYATFLAYIFLQKQISLPYKLAVMSGMGICMAALILTNSRTAVISVSVGLLLLVVASVFNNKDRLKSVALVIAVLFLTAILAYFAPEQVVYRMSTLANISETTSYQARYAEWQEAYHYFTISPVVGWGPAKTTMVTFVENEYVLLLRRYGMLGFISFMCLFAALLIRTLKSSSPQRSYYLAVLVSTMLFMTQMSIFDNKQLMFVFLTQFGLMNDE